MARLLSEIAEKRALEEALNGPRPVDVKPRAPRPARSPNDSEYSSDESSIASVQQPIIGLYLMHPLMILPPPCNLSLCQKSKNQFKMENVPQSLISYFVAGSIGREGLQMFIDAGVPVDDHLVNALIQDVILEKISSMVGQQEGEEPRMASRVEPPAPKPRSRPTSPSKQSSSLDNQLPPKKVKFCHGKCDVNFNNSQLKIFPNPGLLIALHFMYRIFEI